jgi:hypothetical protein
VDVAAELVRKDERAATRDEPLLLERPPHGRQAVISRFDASVLRGVRCPRRHPSRTTIFSRS